MPDGVLTFEAGEVRLGKTLVPGVLVQQSVRSAVRYDESRHDNMSGRQKVVLGWEDGIIVLTLDLLCDDAGDCYDKLAEINRIFKGADKGKSTPRIYEVTGRHARARGIKRVVFDTLDSWETDHDDTIQATLTFLEHLPPVIKREKQANARTSTAAKASTPMLPSHASPAVSPNVAADTTNPFMSGFNAGSGG